MVQVGIGAGSFGMGFRIGGDRDLEIGHALQTGHQISRIGVAARVRRVGAATRYIAAQRHHVAHTGIPVGPRHVIHGTTFGANTCEVRRGRQRGFGDNTRHRGMGARLGAAAGAIRDTDKAWPQRFQPADACPKLGFQRLGARRKELEAQRRGDRFGPRLRQTIEPRAGKPAFQRRCSFNRGMARLRIHGQQMRCYSHLGKQVWG